MAKQGRNGKFQGPAESCRLSLKPKRVFYRRHLEGFWSTFQLARLLLNCEQPLSYHVLCRPTNQPGEWLKAVPVLCTLCPMTCMEPLWEWQISSVSFLLTTELDLSMFQWSRSYPLAAGTSLDWCEATRARDWTTQVHVLALPPSSLLSHLLLTSQ